MGTTPSQLFDRDLADEAREALSRYLSRSKEIWCGRNRVVFDMGTYVVKLPRHALGFGDNDWEGSISNGSDSTSEDVQYARTRLYYYKGIHGIKIPLLFMERVDSDIWKDKHYKDFPDWVGSVDGGQVGYNKQGKLVAFDYGVY
jgi:hypothetical protein